MKKIILSLILIAITMNITAQDTTIVCVDNKKAVQSVNQDKQEGITLLLKKSEYKDFKTLKILVKGAHIRNTIYTKDLEITGESTVIVHETKEKPGNFDLTKTNCKSLLMSGKKLKLTLLLNPANPQMMIPSRMIYLGDLVMK
jgi:hypothetical protein